MTQPLGDEELFELARARVEQKKGFYADLASYCIINAALFLVWRFGTGARLPVVSLAARWLGRRSCVSLRQRIPVALGTGWLGAARDRERG